MSTGNHWWTTAKYINTGDILGDVVDGLFTPSLYVAAALTVEDTNLRRFVVRTVLDEHAGHYGFTVQPDAEFYVFTPTTTQED